MTASYIHISWGEFRTVCTSFLSKVHIFLSMEPEALKIKLFDENYGRYCIPSYWCSINDIGIFGKTLCLWFVIKRTITNNLVMYMSLNTWSFSSLSFAQVFLSSTIIFAFRANQISLPLIRWSYFTFKVIRLVTSVCKSPEFRPDWITRMSAFESWFGTT